MGQFVLVCGLPFDTKSALWPREWDGVKESLRSQITPT